MMPKSRMEVFSDGVLAIVITIMVLELHEPTGASFAALKQVAPTFVAYLLSYAYVGIYWNNHHHLVAALKQASGEILWANLFWIFWMSLMPWATQWLGSHLFATAPTVVWGRAVDVFALILPFADRRLAPSRSGLGVGGLVWARFKGQAQRGHVPLGHLEWLWLAGR